MKDLREYLNPETLIDAFHLQTSTGDYLKIFHLKPSKVVSNTNLLIVGGLTTVVESFAPFLSAISMYFEVYYLETREKKSSRLKDDSQFHMNNFSEDLAFVMNKLFSDKSSVALLGYSLGAAIAIDAYKKMKNKPQALVLLSPTTGFHHYPYWSFLLLRMSSFLNENMMKSFAKWYIGHYVVNSKSDPEMYNISMRAIDSADPSKIKRTILSNQTYVLWDKLAIIDCKTLVVGTSKDGIHQNEEGIRIADSIYGAKFVDLETNDRSHGEELASLIRQFTNDQ